MADQAKGDVPVPTVTETVALYAIVCSPDGSDDVAITGVGLIVNVYGLFAVPPKASVSDTVTAHVHDAVGLPVMTPVFASIDRPAGRPVADQTYGVAPPVAAIAVPG